MAVCDFKALRNASLEDIEASITRYCGQYGPWLSQFDTFFSTTRSAASPKARISGLLDIVRGSGWNMNRQGQCDHIMEGVKSGDISERELRSFWNVVDNLPDLTLRDLPGARPVVLKQIEASVDKIRKTTGGWHPSTATPCFVTKVVLMFNWGQSPAFDSRVRSILRLPPKLSTEKVTQALVEIGRWIRDFESLNAVRLDEFSSDVMNRAFKGSLHPLPLGRSFDMLLFSLKADS